MELQLAFPRDGLSVVSIFEVFSYRDQADLNTYKLPTSATGKDFQAGHQPPTELL